MDTIREANERLRELGYEPRDASVTENGSPARLKLSGSLLRDCTAEPDAMLYLLRMLPPKAHLLAYRHILHLDAD